MSKKFNCLLSLLLIASSAVFGASGSDVGEPDKIKFQLDWIPGGDKAPIYSGIQQGFFAEENIDVEVLSGRGSTDAITRLATGSSHIGASGLGALLSAKAQHNVPVTAIYSLFTKPPHSFLTTEDTGITSVADLKGRSVATSPFTSSNVFLPLILDQNGLEESEIKRINVDPGALGPLLVSGQVDAVIEWMTNAPRHETAMDAAGKKMIILPWYEAGMNGYSTSLVVGDKFLKEQPELVLRFLRAYQKSVAFVQANPELASEDVNAEVPEISAAIALTAILKFNQLSDNEISAAEGAGVFEPARLAETWYWVATSQELDLKGFDPERAVDRSFLETLLVDQ